MIRNIQRTWFEIWGNETAQNQLLKGLLAFLLSLVAVQTLALTLLTLRKPILVAVTPSESRYLSVTPPHQELLNTEIKRAVTGYLQAHYNWEPSNIDDSFKTAAKYVDRSFVKAFLSANQEQIRIAKEKKLSQRFFIGSLSIDFQKKQALAEGERILLVEGLRAASSIRIEIKFDLSSRSPENPEGVFIVGENIISKPTFEGGAR